MQFTLTINCDGEAFEDFPAQEVANILARLMDTADGYSHRNLRTADAGDRTEENPFVLMDRNGARVGTAYFTEV